MRRHINSNRQRSVFSLNRRLIRRQPKTKDFDHEDSSQMIKRVKQVFKSRTNSVEKLEAPNTRNVSNNLYSQPVDDRSEMHSYKMHLPYINYEGAEYEKRPEVTSAKSSNFLSHTSSGLQR